MNELQEFEIHERLRRIESLLLANQEDKTMVITELKVRVESIFNKAHAELKSNRLRKTLLKVKAFILARLDKAQASAEALLDSATFDQGLDDLLELAKGNVRAEVPWWLGWLIGDDLNKDIDKLGDWMKLHKGLLKVGIGALSPQ